MGREGVAEREESPGAGVEIVEDVLLAGEAACLVPRLAVLGAAADVGVHPDPSLVEPGADERGEARGGRDPVASIPVEQDRVPTVEPHALLPDDAHGHGRRPWRWRTRGPPRRRRSRPPRSGRGRSAGAPPLGVEPVPGRRRKIGGLFDEKVVAVVGAGEAGHRRDRLKREARPSAGHRGRRPGFCMVPPLPRGCRAGRGSTGASLLPARLPRRAAGRVQGAARPGAPEEPDRGAPPPRGGRGFRPPQAPRRPPCPRSGWPGSSAHRRSARRRHVLRRPRSARRPPRSGRLASTARRSRRCGEPLPELLHVVGLGRPQPVAEDPLEEEEIFLGPVAGGGVAGVKKALPAREPRHAASRGPVVHPRQDISQLLAGGGIVQVQVAVLAPTPGEGHRHPGAIERRSEEVHGGAPARIRGHSGRGPPARRRGRRRSGGSRAAVAAWRGRTSPRRGRRRGIRERSIGRCSSAW